jgi:hypothetical protein
MNKEIMDRLCEYLSKKGCISIPFIQYKFKMGHKEAKQVYNYFNTTKLAYISTIIRR